ncbi:MAG: exodeoxyribonuclease III [Melioribacteraceae bacterium]|nr:exodeoxyribonuclease III [Melioribacteraceae bacterium]
MKIISWNINGIRAAHKKGFLDWFQKANAEIVCVQETKAQLEQIPTDLTEIENFTFYNNSAERKGYSGVATITSIVPTETTNGLGIEKFDIEGRVLKHKFDNFFLYNIYFPNGKAKKERLDYKMEFYEEFLKILENHKKNGEEVVICGDVNTAHKEIDIARPTENSKVSGFLPMEREWIDRLLALGFVDSFRLFNQEPNQYTWWDVFTRARERNVGWRIDYFFVSEGLKDNLSNAFILQDVMGSDHCPVGIELKF